MAKLDLDNIEGKARAALAMSQNAEASQALRAVPALIDRIRALERVAEAAAHVAKTCVPDHESGLFGMDALRAALGKADACPMDWEDWFAKKGD